MGGVLVVRPYGDCVWPFVCKHPMPHSSATASLLHPTVRKTRCIALSYVRDCRTAHLWRGGCGDIRCDCSGDIRPPLCGIPASSGIPLTSNPSTPTIRRCPTLSCDTFFNCILKDNCCIAVILCEGHIHRVCSLRSKLGGCAFASSKCSFVFCRLGCRLRE